MLYVYLFTQLLSTPILYVCTGNMTYIYIIQWQLALG